MAWKRELRIAFLFALLLAGSGANAADYWSYSLHQEQLCEPLDATAHHFSSWARNGGNNDLGNYYGSDAYGWKILCDATGPGVIGEFWCTRQDAHAILDSIRLRVFVDDTVTWVLDTTLFRFFGHVEPFVPPLADSSTSSFYCYVPIPFQTRGRITYSGQKNLYFHVTTLEFDAGTVVEPFVIPPPHNYLEKLDSLRWRFEHPWEPAWPNRTFQTHSETITLPPEGNSEILNLAGPGGCRRLLCPTADHSTGLLDSVWLEIFSDHHVVPDVEGPLAAVFGAAQGWHPYQSAFTGMLGDTLYLNLPIPFQSELRVEAENRGSASRNLTLIAEITDASASDVEPYRLQAIYRHENPTTPWQLYEVAARRGSGTYLGTLLDMRALNHNIFEGDEEIFLNEESEPSWRGTGTEDYFNAGYYWSAGVGDYDALASHGCIRKNLAQAAAYRWHTTDPVSFTDGFHMTFEVGPLDNLTGDYRSIALFAAPPRAWDVVDAGGDGSTLPGESLRLTGYGRSPGSTLAEVRYDGYVLTWLAGSGVADADSVLDVTVLLTSGLPSGEFPLVAVTSTGVDTVDAAWRHHAVPQMSFASHRLDCDDFLFAGDTLDVIVEGLRAGETAQPRADSYALPWAEGTPAADESGRIAAHIVLPSWLPARDFSLCAEPSFSRTAECSQLLRVRSICRYEIEDMVRHGYSYSSMSTLFAPDYAPTGVDEPWGRDLARVMTGRDTLSFVELAFSLSRADSFRTAYFFGRLYNGARVRMLLDGVLDVADFNTQFATPGSWTWLRSDTVWGEWHHLSADSHVIRVEIAGSNSPGTGLTVILDQLALFSGLNYTPAAPCTPQDLVIAPVADGVELRWRHVREDLLGHPITPDFYSIFRWTSSPDSAEVVAEVSGTDSCYVDRDNVSSPDCPVFYRVTARIEERRGSQATWPTR
ncbi:MAG: DUF2961 domain-containing protein [bacterium]|nr:DUF2961 domain-containing protein [bacterium]